MAASPEEVARGLHGPRSAQLYAHDPPPLDAPPRPRSVVLLGDDADGGGTNRLRG